MRSKKKMEEDIVLIRYYNVLFYLFFKTEMTDREVIGLYHAHGEREQFHSEIKTDMDLKRLPSGKFETNELVLELAILAYNILRMIGQESIGRKGTETKHKVRRRRLRTVIGNMIMMASHVTEHAGSCC